ncbi:hypothetical protein B5E58_07280 [Tyzzerella sp. An114]|uniref:helix-turn-helix transcriptional regulator n=1 Tax=Tyzzerella sp. An114 TaxID=1965545 RepID=UPI000B443EE0|nr:helix-turn-helix transcriptional regulator [Tyzzerella sp. An114]OUQ58416.1 hypothetical protein B5E58_07280 [Tyzzerella sp. An114]HIT72684.1 helix-turn-helix transcriptional regulator [Candidatus Fimicola cottocaccae]
MLEGNIGELLKHSRKRKKLSVNSVVNELSSVYNINTAVKTLYGWEVNRSQPDISTFLALCNIYDIKQPDFAILGHTKNSTKDKSSYTLLTGDEKRLIDTFRQFNEQQKEYISHTFDMLKK